LLTELKVESVLESRGILTGDPLTLTGFRPGEAAEQLSGAPGDGSSPVIVPVAILANLRHKVGPSDNGYLLNNIFETIDAAVDSNPDANLDALRDVAVEIHRISAAEGNDSPGALLPPLDALRQFVRSGSLLHTGYLSDPEIPPLDTATLTNAYSGVGYALSLCTERPVVYYQLAITPDSFNGGYTILEHVASGNSVSLIDFQGNPYAFPDTFSLPVGTRILVEGYADVTSNCPADETIEVIPPASVIDLPVVASTDFDEDLIADEVEELYPVILETFGDSDGDGYSDLQEILDVTDPTNPAEHSAEDPVDLSPPAIAIHESGPDHYTFSFLYPEAYADHFSFRLFSGPDLEAITDNSGLDASHLGEGAFQLIIGKPSATRIFYRFKMLLD
jgi:hypothetical protein